MRYEAYCEGRLVAVIIKDKHGKWEIQWPSRGWSRERISDPTAAKQWIEWLLHGKLVTYVATKDY